MSVYITKIIAFLNARHAIFRGGRQGQIHSHSWQMQVDIRVKSGTGRVVSFEQLQGIITAELVPYEDKVLNEILPFDTIQPLTENLAIFFFRRIAAAVEKCGVELDKLSLWESPTKGIEISDGRTEYLRLDEDGPGTADARTDRSLAAAEMTAGELQAAAARETAAKKDGTQTDREEKSEESHFFYPRSYYLAAAVILLLAILTVYRRIISAPPELADPWGSDTWGHLFKAEFLYNEIMQGNYFPQLLPAWYNGVQPFRYWAPLPYYCLAFFRFFTGNVFVAGNYFLTVNASCGGISWLGFARRIGMLPALLAGFLWAVWPDNVRVAFSEGNLPRVMAIALLPLLFLIFYSALEKMRWRFVIGAILLVQTVILCHAMLGAVTCLCLFAFSVLLWAFGGCPAAAVRRGGLTLVGGVAGAAWWLLPALQGGIAGSPNTAAGGVEFVPAAMSLNPWLRLSSPETFYWGVSLAVAAACAFRYWRLLVPWMKSLAVLGTGLVLITFPALQGVHRLLPGSGLLWPLRFSTFASFAILAAGFGAFSGRPTKRKGGGSKEYSVALPILALFLLFAADSMISFRLLAVTRERPEAVTLLARDIATTAGWRVGTIDLSRLGSIPSYVLTAGSGREQVFGWAWQGAATAPNIMRLNTAVTSGHYPFLFSRLRYLGATDLLVKDDIVADLADFARSAGEFGYRPVAAYDGISCWRNGVLPYVVIKEDYALAVGRGASNFAMLLPLCEIGHSLQIDDYSLAELQSYPLLVLSGAGWRNRKAAEALALAYAETGGKLIVDLTGFPPDPAARQPAFLGVYGEPVTLTDRITVRGTTGDVPLQPFSPAFREWNCLVPQGLDLVERYFDYHGVRGAVIGSKIVEGIRIHYLGVNLAYHAFLTRDPAARLLLLETLGLPPAATGRMLPLSAYHSSSDGYILQYESGEALEAVIPVAALDGMQAEIDGQPTAYRQFEQLLQLSLPAGKHRISLFFRETPIYWYGKAVSLLTLAVVAIGVVHSRRKMVRPGRSGEIWGG
ncbi:MAG: 6-pyruvoyl-tetrahydropterin synthase-related protein [bacterium]